MTESKEDQTIQRPSAAKKEGKYLTFSLAGEEYGIGILKIKEIIGMMPITPVPQAGDYIKGVINLRGRVIPVIDLRLRFDVKVTAFTDRTCIVVVELDGKNGTILMGLVVDSVSEVLNIKEADIEDTPVLGIQVDTTYILGMAKTEGGVKILLDIDQVVNGEKATPLKSAA